MNNRGVTFSYRPATNSWTKLANGPAVPNLQTADVVAWAGSRMLVLGLTNGAFNPVTNTWHPTAPDPNRQGQGQAVVGWTGRQILVWGGLASSDAPSPHGQAYNPATDRWTALPTSPLRGGAAPAAVWTGRQMIIWGGYNYTNGTTYADGAAYTPSTP